MWNIAVTAHMMHYRVIPTQRLGTEVRHAPRSHAPKLAVMGARYPGGREGAKMGTGLRFRKIDLHVHTPASNCFPDKNVSPDDLVDAALSRGLHAIAITDHHTGEWIDRVKQAAKDKELVAFPGVEITASEGCHIVALMDPRKGTKDIDDLLSALDIMPDQRGRADTVCKHSAFDIVETITARDGLAILAHVDGPRGILECLKPGPLKLLVDGAPYVAMETSSGTLPPSLAQDGGFVRRPPCYQASDNPDPNDPKKHACNGIGARYSHFKLDETITLESLRQCFVDPTVRICGMESMVHAAFPRIISLRASDGFLRYQNIRFHQGLNSIIGGKGVGKSLIVEFLRFALDQPSSETEILKDHRGKLEKRLGRLNSVEVICETPSGTQYKITRTLDGPCECIALPSGEAYNGSIRELFPILAYSQTEVIKISENKDAQLELIDSFTDTRPYVNSIAALDELLLDNDRLLAEAIQAERNLEAYKKDLHTVKGLLMETDKQLAGGGMETALFNEFKVLEAKKQTLEAQQAYLRHIREVTASAYQQVEGELPPSPATEQEQDSDVSAVHQECVDARNLVLQTLKELSDRLDRQIGLIAGRIKSWHSVYDKKEKEYQDALGEQQQRKELEVRRRRLLQQFEETKAKVNACEDKASALDQLDQRRTKLLDKLDEAHLAFFTERKGVFDRLAERSNGKLRLQLSHASNRQQFRDQLRELVRGSGARVVDIDAIAEKMMPRQFVSLVRRRAAQELADRAEITVNAAQTIIERLWSGETIQPVLSLEHSCYPEDTPSIEFRKDDGQYAPLTELSVGQKCTALLIIALSEGTRPVIIDQPEDALDITTVWEDVSKKLRQGKHKRQFILTTHNPTVAVASDSDMFIVLRSGSKQANVKCLGAIEHPDVRKAVIQHLEGGEEPYRLRRYKYNIDV